MQEKQFFIFNKKVFSVAIFDGENLIEKTFNKEESEKILNFLLLNGAELIEKDNVNFLKGNFFVFGDMVVLDALQKIKLRRWIDCNSQFYIKSGFVKDVSLNNIKNLLGKLNLQSINSAVDLKRVWNFLKSKKKLSQEDKRNLIDDSLMLLNNNFKGFEFIWSMWRISNNLKLLYQDNKINSQDLNKILSTFLSVIKNNMEESKVVYYFDILQNLEKSFLKDGRSCLDIIDYQLASLLRQEVWNKTICTAIFWEVKGELKIYPVWYLKSNPTVFEMDKIDCPLEHFKVWELNNSGLYDDFATFPRGRILYDVIKKENIIYSDKCITQSTIKKIVKLLQIEQFRQEKDEHYSCDKCINNKSWL